VIDDLLATGGTAASLIELLEGLGHEVVAVAAALAKPQYGGIDRVREKGHTVTRLIDLYVERSNDKAVLRLVGQGPLSGREEEIKVPVKAPRDTGSAIGGNNISSN